MSENLSASQKKIKNEIVLRAIGSGAGIALLISGVVYFIFAIEPMFARIGLSLIVFTVSFFIATKVTIYFLSGDYQCEACNATYSIELIDTEEIFLSAIPRSAIKNGGRVTSGDREGKHIVIHENWTEEKYDVTRKYRCVVCGDTYQEQGVETRKTSFSSTKTYR